MCDFDGVLRSMDFTFCGQGRHKITMENFLSQGDGVFLDVRSREEVAALPIRLEGLAEVLHIPIEEVPDRKEEIPRDRLVGIFCSAATRATVVYAYLRAHGYEQVRVIPGGYGPVTDELIPGKLFKRLSS